MGARNPSELPFLRSRQQRRVHIVDILFVQLLAQQLHRLAEALEVDNLAFAQEPDDVVDIRVVAEPGMLSYVTRAFCSAAISSTRSAIGSPVTAMVAADHGVPEAACG